MREDKVVQLKQLILFSTWCWLRLKCRWLRPEKPIWDYTQCKHIPDFPFLPHDIAVCIYCGTVVKGWDHPCQICTKGSLENGPLPKEEVHKIWQQELTKIISCDITYGGSGTWYLHKKRGNK